MAQPEARLSRAILELIRARGGFAFKVHGGPMMMVGLPDIVACYRGRFLALETKMPGGSLHGRQPYVLSRIARAGGIVRVPRSVPDALALLDAIDDGGDVPLAPWDELTRADPAVRAPGHESTRHEARRGTTITCNEHGVRSCPCLSAPKRP